MNKLGVFKGIKTNKHYRKFEGNGKSIFENGTFYDQPYLVLTTDFSFEVRYGKHEEWDDVLYYSTIDVDGSLSYPKLSKT